LKMKEASSLTIEAPKSEKKDYMHFIR
jgi:hypothetical protein